MSERLSYDQVADLIEATLGVRPATSTLRAAAARRRTRSRPGRPSVTSGMPPPRSRPTSDVAGGGDTNTASVSPQLGGPNGGVFDAAEVRAWLTTHPWRKQAQTRQRLARARVTDLDAAVVSARGAGLSWGQVAEVLAEAHGIHLTRQGAQQRFGGPRRHPANQVDRRMAEQHRGDEARGA